MRLDVLLVEKNLCSSRQEAQECIKKGFVIVDGMEVIKPSKDILRTAEIVLLAGRKYVGRGGEKLEGLFLKIFDKKENIEHFLEKKSALDIGSSTGGFTDFLISHGVRSVIAVDVGSGQMHSSLLNNSKVTLYESTDIRTFGTDQLFDVIVADLSFISLFKVMEKILSFGSLGSYYFLLIKPQFEVGKGNTKKGVVKDIALVKDILENYRIFLKSHNVKDLTILPCVIQGGDGNQEYFLHFVLR